MILSGDSLREKIRSRQIVIEPCDEATQIQPASVDLTLSDEFLKLDDHIHSVISFDSEVSYTTIKTHEFVLPPKSFVLAKTKEFIKIPLDYAAFLEGRSSIGRLGLFIENAGWIDPGFEGTITLELFNANSIPVKLKAGTRVSNIVFLQLDKPLKKGYEGKYKGQQAVTGSKIYLDPEAKKKFP
ncbi:MAG TPA: dCTP deaminase [archaeon]|nr:dCTP deaminase [archaeon]